MSRILKNYPNKISNPYKKGVHEAVDIIGDNGKNNNTGYLDYVLAHSNGEVVEIRENYKTNDKSGVSYGNYVKLYHNNGYYTLYAHLKYGSIKVKLGDKVTKGQIIGYMGNTGKAIGAHLHFEVRDANNIKINPTMYIDADLPVNEENLLDEDLLMLVKKTIRGDYGNGEERKIKLGNSFREVQKQVDLNYNKGTTNWDNIKLY